MFITKYSAFSITQNIWFIVLQMLINGSTLKRLGAIYFLKRVRNRFFVSFNIIISHIFFKNFIEICSSCANVLTKFSDNISYFHHFSSIFSIFLAFSSYKETNDISWQQIVSPCFHFQHILNGLFNNCIKLHW